MDFAGPFMGQMFLIMVDAQSKWIEAHIMSNITAPTTIDKLRAVFAVHGLPDTLVTDNGTSFTSELFTEFMQQNGIHHIQTAPFHPASNGLVEWAVQTVKEGLKGMTGDFHVSCSKTTSHHRLQLHARPQRCSWGAGLSQSWTPLHPDMKARVERKQVKQKELHDQHARERQLNQMT